ncbi:MAG TPA: M15 family metallopeptidase [Staphylococcus kloosii]|uniref:M15 family metallopeptidase n=1 Tax=Staphylococcus kloosii TaxID=29384 RepID=A0A921H1K1_9STAP|nr:M15 family metallopeptidase [Staphylococcus kloosii]HJF69013.1 M15 family metallopeptidase [Staphylococcus kloosii]
MKKFFGGVTIVLIISFIVFICFFFFTRHDSDDDDLTYQIVKPKNALPIITEEHGVTKVNGHVVVNKHYTLPPSHKPGEDKHAKKQLNKLLAAAEKDNIDLKFRSGYRSYQDQQEIMKKFVKEEGKEQAKHYTAIPGHSEHQTGLAFDVGTDAPIKDFKKDFGKSKEGKWLAQHAPEYGFIIRYPKGQEKETGYSYEAWHIRYVGPELAKIIKDENTNLETYYNLPN